MKYFDFKMTLNEVKTAYRKHALKLHPDMGGSNEAMAELTKEFEIAFAVAKRNAPEPTKETAISYEKEIYTQHGWKGTRYKADVSVPAIAKIVKDYIKHVHPTYKFSVTSDYNLINIALMEYPIELTNYDLMKKEVERFIRTDKCFYVPSINENIRGVDLTEEQKEEHIQCKLNKINTDKHSLNHYYLNEIKWINPVILEVLKDIYSFTQSYNYDHSDIATDYFDKNFYVQLAIGKYEKPAKLVERTARISPTKKVKDAKLLTA